MVEITIESSLVKGIHRVDPHWSADQLAKKLELITGIPPESQKISITSTTNTKYDLQPNQTLQDAGVSAGFSIYVADKNHELSIEDDGNIEDRYQMPIDEYEKRQNTVLDWKRKNNLDRFSQTPEPAPTKENSKPTSTIGPVTVSKSEECYVTLSSGKTVRGVVEFIGEVASIQSGTWVGVRLFSPEGKNDGSVKGQRLFDALPNHGTLVRPNAVRPLSADEEEI